MSIIYVLILNCANSEHVDILAATELTHLTYNPIVFILHIATVGLCWTITVSMIALMCVLINIRDPEVPFMGYLLLFFLYFIVGLSMFVPNREYLDSHLRVRLAYEVKFVLLFATK